MTDQNKSKYTFKTAETFQADALIRKAAAKIIQANKSNLETVNAHVLEIRQKLNAAKPKKKGYFSVSHLRDFANKRRLLCSQKVNIEVA